MLLINTIMVITSVLALFTVLFLVKTDYLMEWVKIMGISYNNKFFNTKKKLSHSDIDHLESKYNFSYPKDIRNHYLTYNGGETEKYVFVDKDGDEYIVQQFLPISSGNRDVASILDNLRGDNILPEWLIPFADEPSGDFYCFSIKEGEEGEVYLWYHEVIYDPEDSYSFLANSIEEFINGMKEDIN
jgi:cell wall assembly regulator SMI1